MPKLGRHRPLVSSHPRKSASRLCDFLLPNVCLPPGQDAKCHLTMASIWGKDVQSFAGQFLGCLASLFLRTPKIWDPTWDSGPLEAWNLQNSSKVAMGTPGTKWSNGTLIHKWGTSFCRVWFPEDRKTCNRKMAYAPLPDGLVGSCRRVFVMMDDTSSWQLEMAWWLHTVDGQPFQTLQHALCWTPAPPNLNVSAGAFAKVMLRVGFFRPCGANAPQAALTLNFGGEGVVYD